MSSLLNPMRPKKMIESNESTQDSNPRSRGLWNSIILQDSPAIQMWDGLFGAETAYIGSKKLLDSFLVAVHGCRNRSYILKDTEDEFMMYTQGH